MADEKFVHDFEYKPREPAGRGLVSRWEESLRSLGRLVMSGRVALFLQRRRFGLAERVLTYVARLRGVAGIDPRPITAPVNTQDTAAGHPNSVSMSVERMRSSQASHRPAEPHAM